jgi:hypothetical protein
MRRVLRQDPDVILIGEMRDEETVRAALSAAETGHLVLSTVHTLDASESINRILDFFPPHQHTQARAMIAGTLKGVISQRLVRSVDGKRVAVCEVLRMTGRVRDMIKDPEQMGKLGDVIFTGGYYGMQTFDQALFKHVKAKRVSFDDALRVATSPHDFKLLVEADGKRGTTMDDVAEAAEKRPGGAPSSPPAPVAPGAGGAVTPGVGAGVTPGAGTGVSPGAGNGVTPGAGNGVTPGAGNGNGVTPGAGTGVTPGAGTAPPSAAPSPAGGGAVQVGASGPPPANKLSSSPAAGLTPGAGASSSAASPASQPAASPASPPAASPASRPAASPPAASPASPAAAAPVPAAGNGEAANRAPASAERENGQKGAASDGGLPPGAPTAEGVPPLTPRAGS